MSFPPGLPTNVLRKDTRNEDVLHVGYLPGLFPRGHIYDKPYYRGDVYEDRPTLCATQWEREMYEVQD